VREFSQLKVAIAHYWLIRERGGEKVLKNLLELFPQADVYTLFYDPKAMAEMLEGHAVYSSILNYTWLRSHYTKIFPLYPIGVRSLELKKNYDLLISSESGPIKGIERSSAAKHLCYTHTPMRYCWEHTEEYLRDLPFFIKPFVKSAFEKLRRYDVTTIDNVDLYLANSQHVSDRIKKYYKKNSLVIHPPIEDHILSRNIPRTKLRQSLPYVSFGALVPYKRIDLLVETFKLRQEHLIVIGEGSERKRLEQLAPTNVSFTGALSWEKAASLIENAKALIFPGEEDFGLIPVEATALGCPVIAFGKGGVLETVVCSAEPKFSTGLFFQQQSVSSLSSALDQYHRICNEFSPQFMKDHAKKFSKSIFKDEISKAVRAILSE